MNRKKLRRIELVPDQTITPSKTLSHFDELCRLFKLDQDQDSHATRKLRIWHRPCQEQILVF